jgi:hypothetical protein
LLENFVPIVLLTIFWRSSLFSKLIGTPRDSVIFTISSRALK